MVVTAFKRSEDDPNSFVVRLAEQRGITCMEKVWFKLPKAFVSATLVNGLENDVEDVDSDKFSFDAKTQMVTILVEPFKIMGIKLRF